MRNTRDFFHPNNALLLVSDQDSCQITTYLCWQSRHGGGLSLIHWAMNNTLNDEILRQLLGLHVQVQTVHASLGRCTCLRLVPSLPQN